MDDIICPECGRPNLSEANKCWYCQTELVSPAENQGMLDEIPGKDPPSSNFNTQPQAKDTEDSVGPEEIPDWLAKIRKKIEEERRPEEELPYWKQKDIFGGEKKVEKKEPKNSQQKKSSEKKAGADEKEKEIIEPETSKQEQSDIDLDDLSNDLPEGFKKI